MSPARRLLWPAALVCAMGCARSQPGDVTLHLGSAKGGTAVARFDGQSVSSEEIARSLQAMAPALRAHYAKPEDRKAYVEEVARFQVLVQKAAKEGLANDPEVIAATERMMVHRLLTRSLQATPPTDTEVAAYFEAHRTEFARPEMVRLGEIFLAANASDAKARAQVRARMAELAKKVKALPASDLAGFGELARHESDDPRAKMLGGDLRYLTRELLAREYGPEVANAGFTLEKAGDSTTVETPRGIYLLRLLNRTEPFTPTLDRVRPEIVARLGAERRNQQLVEFVKKAEQDAHLTVDEKAIAALPVDVHAPAKPLGQPAPDVFSLPRPAPPGVAR